MVDKKVDALSQALFSAENASLAASKGFLELVAPTCTACLGGITNSTAAIPQ